VLGYFETASVILLPSRYRLEQSKLRQMLEEAHLAWQIAWKARQDDFVIENIRFTHDPLWRYRFLSIQSARDANHWMWKATGVLIGFGGMI
jgi:hypothetical protein